MSRSYDDPLSHIHGAGSSSIPMFNQHGTALSQEERENIAKKKGICVGCGVKTHEVKVFKSKQLTNDHVYQGVCIRDYPSRVPTHIYQEWESKFKPQVAAVQAVSSGHRLRGVARTVQATAAHHIHLHPPGGPSLGSSGVPAGLPPAGFAGGSSMAHLPAPSFNGLPRAAVAPSSREVQRDHQPEPSAVPRFSPPPLAPSPPSSRTPNLGTLTPLAAGSDTMVSEDYTGGNSNEGAWQIMTSIRENMDKPTSLKQKLHRLRNIGEDQAGALFEIKEVMNHHINDSRVMAAAVGALWAVTAENDDRKEEAAVAGIINDVVDALRNPANQRDSDFAAWAIGCLCSLARGRGNRGALAKAGSIEAIVESLRRHPNSGAVFEWSSRALHSLVHCYENEGDEDYRRSCEATIRMNIVYIDEADCIPALVSSMKNNSSEAIPQLWAMRLLWRLQDRDDEHTSRRVIQKMSDENFLLVLVKVLKARTTTPLVYEYTASLMFNVLAGSRTQNIPEEASDCLRSTLRMMIEYPLNESLQEACCRLLSALTSGCKLQIKEANGLVTVVAVMAKFPSNLELQEACIWILWAMSYIPAFFDYAVLGEAFDALQATVEVHSEAPTLFTGICGLIANVVLSSNVVPQEIPVNLPILALSMRLDERRLHYEAGRALANMCVQSANLSRKVVDNNGIQALVDCLKGSSGQTAHGVLGALSAIASSSDANKSLLIQEGCLQAAKEKIKAGSAASTEKALELISALVTGERRAAMQLPNDIFFVIVQAMRTQLRSDHSMEIACGTMRNLLCVSTPGARTLNFDDIVEYMTGIITNRSSDIPLKIEACGVLWAFTARHTVQYASDLSKIFRSVLGVMSLYKGDDQPFNTELQSFAAGAMVSVTNRICDTPIHLTAEDVEEIIAVMYMAMEYDLENVELLDTLLDVMLNLGSMNERMVIESGGIVVVIDAMVEHEQHECIQDKGCSILALLSSTENLQVNLCIADTDGIDMIVSALAVFSTNQRIQVDACRTLAHLSVDQESRMLIASQGGLILVVNAMSSNRGNVELLEAACTALLNLSSDAEEQVIADSNVVETVVSLMKYHPDAPMLQEKALGVLQNVSMRNSGAKASICQAGGVTAVAMAIREFMGSPSVLERAFTTMWSLAVLERNQVEIANSGGIGLVVNGMMANINCEKVQKQACGCLCTLSSNSRNKTLIREAGGVDAIVFAMWAHYDSEILQIEACRALSSLAVNVQTNEVMIATDGEINAIISAMRRFSESAKLQEHACVALRNFMLSQDNADLIRGNANELVGLLRQAASRFPDRCQERANQVLASLG